MNDYERATQIAVSTACTSTYAVEQELLTVNDFPTRTSVTGISTDVLSERSPTCAISLVPKRFSSEHWAAVEFPVIDAATEYTITINGDAYTCNPAGADLKAGLLAAFITAWGLAPIADVAMEIDVDRIVVYGSGIITITCGAATGTGTVLGKCDAVTATINIFALVSNTFWCRTPIGPRYLLAGGCTTDIYGIGPYEQLTGVMEAVTKNGTVFGTGFAGCVLVVYTFGISGAG